MPVIYLCIPIEEYDEIESLVTSADEDQNYTTRLEINTFYLEQVG